VPRDPSLRDELLAMADAELDAGSNAELRQRAEEDAARLDAIVGEHAWPGLRLVGAEATDAAWLIAYHADADNPRRRRWLPLLAEAVVSGDADPRHLATLTDRVAATDGQPQVYGTILMLAADGEVELPVPALDAARLDDRRAEIGLSSIMADAAHLGAGDLIPYRGERTNLPVLQWPLVLEGHVSVEAALEAGVRRVHRVWAVRPGDRRLVRLRALARERGVLIDQVDRETIDELASGRTHGGVVALVGPRYDHRVEQLFDEVGEGSLVVMLDGIEDPFNYGQAVRALYAAGVDGVLVRRSWETALATVTRASAGATELLPAASTDTADAAALVARSRGMRVACAVADPDAVDLTEADLTGGLLLLIGGERRGVTRSFVEQADLLVRIGYGRERAPELGAAASAAIIAFEARRQRSRAG
jgi:23S rRNA (guanosine2251-2'-O)-methyltransferase